MEKFETEIAVRWSDVDHNKHVRHSAYNDYGAHARIQFFIHTGYDAARMDELNIGPILFHEECFFIKEIKLEDTIRINVLRGRIKEDGSRWVFHHEIFNSKNEKVAHITVTGAWMDMNHRKLTVPPKEIADSMLALVEGEPFVYKKASE
jgi:acyl-CoA thioester hydrolase